MALSLQMLTSLLATGGIRHHLDAEAGTIRVVFVTHGYRNPRLERLAILGIEAVDGGRRCRIALERAFAAGQDARATCLALCQVAGEIPLARVEYDQSSETLRLVAEFPVEDGNLTSRQLFAMLDAVVEAAEVGHGAIMRSARASNRGRRRDAA